MFRKFALTGSYTAHKDISGVYLIVHYISTAAKCYHGEKSVLFESLIDLLCARHAILLRWVHEEEVYQAVDQLLSPERK